MRKFLKAIISWIKNFLRTRLNLRSQEMPYYITIGISVVFFIAALGIFVNLTDELYDKQLDDFDNSIFSFVTSFRSDGVTAFFKFMTRMGNRSAYLYVSIALGLYLFFRHKNWKYIVQTIAVLLLATATNMVLKNVINRARPTHEHLVKVYSLSFPSGHAMSAMAFYGFLIYLTLVSKGPVFIKAFICTLLALIIFSIGVSRIYLGVHFPSDVAAGFVGGLIWVTLCIVVFNVFSMLRKRKNPTIAE